MTPWRVLYPLERGGEGLNQYERHDEKSVADTDNRTPAFQPLVRRCTDRAG
jgi:hypothetical protein